MNRLPKCDRPKRHLKPIILALALVLPGSAALAASVDDVVKTRADQNIDQHYGRDSVYAFSAESKPLSPDRTFGSRWFPSLANADVVSESELTAVRGTTADGTATEFDRGYYQDPEEVAMLEDDGTATRFDRGYYQDPDGLAILDDDTATEFDRGYFQEPDRVAILVILPDGTPVSVQESGSAEE